MPIEFRILGPLEVSAEGRVLPLGSPKQRALLGLLLVHANETVSRDRLIEELWGEAAPATVESALHVYLSRLRRLLESAGARDALVHEAWGYELRVEPDQLDANRFERLVHEGSEALAAGNPPVAARCLREALALWRGPALADLQSERFAIDAGARLEEQRISALEQRLEADLALGRDHELVPELETLLAEHPYREGLRAQLMLALYRSGRQVEALHVYQQARRTLAEELGLEPGQELKELERAILRNDPTLTVPAPEAGRAPLAPIAAGVSVPPAERKVVTVVVAEMVVDEDCDEPDPEDVRALQQRYLTLVRAAVEQYGGTVQTLVGNAVTAVFGAPRVHEDDPERAVRAALTIRDWAHGEKQVEVGIVAATGEALVRLLAEPTVGESVLAGEIVGTAAHVQAAAPTGAVLVGERTYRATRKVIDYREAESVHVRGKTESIRVWEALAVRSGVGADAAQRERSPFVGRERELRLLQATLTRVRGERAPELVTLVGVPGIGKSRLVEELRHAAAAERGTTISWRQGRSLPYGDGVSLWALSEIVKAQLGVLESDTDEQVEQELGRAVKSLLGVGREPEWVARELRPLLGITRAGAVASGDRDETFAAWRRFFEALAERRQLVLVFEDLHWADEVLLDFVEGLADWVSGVPLLIVAVARPELLERRPHWAGGKPNAVTLSLAPLSEEESVRLLAALSQHLPSTPEARSTLLAKIGGNPFYAEQYARALDEGAESRELPLPESVQGMIAARLDLLPPAEKSLLQDAAVLGEVFWAGAAAALQEIDPSAAEAQLRALERKQFLQHAVQSSVANESEYAFGHLLLRDIAYAQIPRAARATKHQQAAAWIESLGRPRDHAEALAHHYTCALELTSAAGDDKVEIAARARVALRDAGDRAGALNAAAAAARYYERALELWPEHDHERPQLLFRYASALHTIGDPRQEQMLAQARELLLAAGDIDTAAQADALLAYMWWLAGADEGIERHLLRAAALVLGRPPSAAKARVLALISRLSMLTSKNEEAIRSGREALTIADTLHLPELRADALISVGMGRLATWDAAGVVDIERGLELALAHNALSTAAGGYTNLAAVMLARGDLVRQEQLLAQSEVLAQQLGDPQRIRLLRAYRLTSTPFWRGDWDEVLRFADEFIAECEAGAPHMMESGIRVVRATIRLARDDTHGALADCEKAVAHARHVGQPDTAARVLGYSAGIYLELGRLDQAQTLADEALSYDPDLSLLSLALAWDTDALGRRPEVVAALALLPSNNPWRRGAELIREGRFDRAADTFAEIGASMQEARTRLRAAQTLAKQSRNDDAEKQLEKALVFYRSVQATRYIRQAEALLAGTRTGSKRDRGVVALPTADT